MSECELLCIPPEHIDLVWRKVRPLIVSGVERCDFSDFASVECDVLSNDALLWVAYDGKEIAGALVTQITKTEKRKICTLVAGGGHGRKRWLGLLDQIEQYAKAEGCSVTRIIGREGWAAVLPAYHQRCVVLERDL
mgnify:CR=1 FL=1